MKEQTLELSALDDQDLMGVVGGGCCRCECEPEFGVAIAVAVAVAIAI